MSQAMQTPLVDLLRGTPRDGRVCHEESSTSHHFIPYGRLCHEAADTIEALRQALRNVYEVWAGSEGIPMPETCPEAYLLKLVEQMRDEAKKGLK